jgi:hypothetical protein
MCRELIGWAVVEPDVESCLLPSKEVIGVIDGLSADEIAFGEPRYPGRGERGKIQAPQPTSMIELTTFLNLVATLRCCVFPK